MSSINLKFEAEVDGKKITSEKLGSITFRIFAKIKEKIMEIPFHSFSVEFLELLHSFMGGKSSKTFTPESITQDPIDMKLTITLADKGNLEIGDSISLQYTDDQKLSALSNFEIASGNTMEDMGTETVFKVDAVLTDPTIADNIITCTDEDSSLIYTGIDFINNTSIYKEITGISSASEAVFTSATHGLSDGDIIVISGLGDGTSTGTALSTLNNTLYKVYDKDADSFKLYAWNSSAKTFNTVINSTTYKTYDDSSGGVLLKGTDKLQVVLSGVTTNKCIQLVIGTSPTAGILGSEVAVSNEIINTFTDLTFNVDVATSLNVLGLKLVGTGVTTLYKFDIIPVLPSTVNTASEVINESFIIENIEESGDNYEITVPSSSVITITSGVLPSIESMANTLYWTTGESHTRGILLGKANRAILDKSADIKYSQINKNGGIYDHNSAGYGDTTISYNIVGGVYILKLTRYITWDTTESEITDLYFIAEPKNNIGGNKLLSWDEFPETITLDDGDVIKMVKELSYQFSGTMGGLNTNFARILYNAFLTGKSVATSPFLLINTASNTVSAVGVDCLKLNATENVATWGVAIGNTASSSEDLATMQGVGKVGVDRKSFGDYFGSATVSGKTSESDVVISSIAQDGENKRYFTVQRLFTATTDRATIGASALICYNGGVHIPIAYNLLKGIDQSESLMLGQNLRITYTFSIDHTDTLKEA